MSSLVAKSLKEILTFTRASTATYFDIDGALTTAEVDEPRIEYDPATGAVRGLLIEEARTNLILNSETFATQSVTVAAAAHTLSFYGTGTITLSGASTAGPLVGTADGERVSLTFTPSAGSLTLTLSGTATRAQLESGAYATSYIPTTSTAVTRAADVCTTSVLNPWFNAEAGTLFVEFATLWTYSADDATIHRYLAELDDGSTLNRHALYINEGHPSGYTKADDTLQADPAASVAVTAGGVMRAAYAWETDSVALASTGSSVITDNSAAMPAGISTFNLGEYTSGINKLNGYIRKVKFYPRRLSDNELRALVA